MLRGGSVALIQALAGSKICVEMTGDMHRRAGRSAAKPAGVAARPRGSAGRLESAQHMPNCGKSATEVHSESAESVKHLNAAKIFPVILAHACTQTCRFAHGGLEASCGHGEASSSWQGVTNFGTAGVKILPLANLA